jgi:hypothetical protein
VQHRQSKVGSTPPPLQEEELFTNEPIGQFGDIQQLAPSSARSR